MAYRRKRLCDGCATADDLRRIYWDVNGFLAYVNGSPEWLPTLDAILAEVERRPGKLEIVTSTLSIVEVAFAAHEQTGKVLDPATEERIDGLWSDRSVIKLADFHQLIARDARGLMRMAVSRGRSLKPNDAIHLATARRIDVAEFQTFDARLDQFRDDLGFPIVRPHTSQPMLPLSPPA